MPIEAARTPFTRDPILVDLALQGGGSHGARSARPRGKRASPSVTMKVMQHCIRHRRLSSMLDEPGDYLAKRI
jgi:hypothetical protein